MDDAWAAFSRAFAAAVRAFVRGDAGPYKALWSHGAEVTVFGAFGGRETGWDQIGPRLDWAAAQYRDGTYAEELLAEHVGADVACRVHLEHLTVPAVDGGELRRERRVTHVLRREAAGWRIVHQHSDPQVSKQAPPPR